MSYKDKLQQIEQLRQAIEKHGKLAAELLNKINYKLRLEWNYTSNSMEGNSLTKEETRSVMVGNITVEGKPIKDVLEIKGHDEVITQIIKMGKAELNISESRIKEIHKGIMHEEDPEKKKKIGVWKTEPNYLFNYKNERFDFVAPADVPERMHELINRLTTQKEKIQRGDKDALHPVQLAFQFHLDYITIHPFYDGNGRTVRILTNLILISYGYPPIYVKEIEKGPYYQYLADIQGYGGNPDLFFDFMAGLLIRSLQIVLDAIEGREIEETDDWEKQLSLLKRELAIANDVEIERSQQSIEKVISQAVLPLIEKLIIKLDTFSDLFAQKVMRFGTKSSSTLVATKEQVRELCYTPGIGVYSSNDIVFTYELQGFKKNGTNAFYVSIFVSWDFQPFVYYFFINHSNFDKSIIKPYHHETSEEEINTYVAECAKQLLEQIEKRIRR